MKFMVFLAGATLACVSINPVKPAEKTLEADIPAGEMTSVDYLIGTWSCAHTVGTFSGRYTTSYSKALGDRWLRETWNFPPGNAGNLNEGAVSAEALMAHPEQTR